jgi:hypothetical protein
MGSTWSKYNSPYQKHYKIIYLQDQRNCCYCINWPENYVDLLQVLRIDFNYKPFNNTILIDGVSEQGMYVKSQPSFEGLIPRYKKIQPDIDIFYIGLKIEDNT